MSMIFKNSTSMKDVSSAFIAMLLVTMSIFLNVAHCRVLRSMDGTDAACDQVQRAGLIGKATFAVSSNNSSNGTGGSPSESGRSLASQLTSGPSGRGPGH